MKTASFSKSLKCPTSEQLLALHSGRCENEQESAIRRHLPECDFCSAELEFYSHVPHLPEDPERTEGIPSHLYELAEALLNNRSSGISALKSLIAKKSDQDHGLS